MSTRARNIIVTAIIEIVLVFVAAFYAWDQGLKQYLTNFPTTECWVVPGDHTTHVEQPGTYFICWEYKSVLDSVDYSCNTLPGTVHTVMIDQSNGDTIPMTRVPRKRMRYSVIGRAGFALFRTHLPHPGAYRIAASYENGASEPKVVFALLSDASFWRFLFSLWALILLVPLLMAIPIIYFAVRKSPRPPGPVPPHSVQT